MTLYNIIAPPPLYLPFPQKTKYFQIYCKKPAIILKHQVENIYFSKRLNPQLNSTPKNDPHLRDLIALSPFVKIHSGYCNNLECKHVLKSLQ